MLYEVLCHGNCKNITAKIIVDSGDPDIFVMKDGVAKVEESKKLWYSCNSGPYKFISRIYQDLNLAVS